MVSSLVPPSKRKNKHKSKPIVVDVPQNNGFNTKKRKEPPPPLKLDMSPLYKEDLGMAGVKKSKPSSKPVGPILKGPENQKFAITESAEEKLRRLRRKVRTIQKSMFGLLIRHFLI